MGDREAFTYDLNDYHYELPESLIAQEPLKERESCRLMVLDRSGETLDHRRFDEIGWFLKPGDLLVLNDTRVLFARLQGMKPSGGKIELLVLDPRASQETPAGVVCTCLVKAAKPPRGGSRITLKDGLQAEVMSAPEKGRVQIRLLTSDPLSVILERAGEVPLPPYIHRDGLSRLDDDATFYQTVYAREPGSIAAPTAGLHFSPALLKELAERGVEVVALTLHVGYGTFAPMRVKDIREHTIHREYAEISLDAADRIARAKAEGRRIVAVGTTSVRVLENAALNKGWVEPFSGYCDLYIYPGFRFLVVDALITNFHLPQSSLFLLVSAFAGRKTMLRAYEEAVRKEYRFFSYGDAMLIQ